MPKLRPTAIQQVTRELAATRFGLVGFEVKFPDSGNPLVSISFLGLKGQSFKIGPSSQTAVFVNCSPGVYKTEDTAVFESFDEAVECIQPWARRIYDDLRVRTPDLSEFESFRQTLDAHLKNTAVDEQAPFTEAEVSDLGAKLSALEQRLGEMEEKHLITEKELRELRQVVGDAKKDLPVMSKGVWYRTAGGKLWEVMKKAASTSEGRQLLADAAKKLLGM